MANSPTSIETQIDSFLEQFKRSASKAMEERMEWPDGPSPGGIVKSRSSCFTLDSSSGEAECDGCGSDGEDGRSVGELLLPQYALATGGLARDHRPLITFPDNNNFHVLSAAEYRRLLLYLTSVPSILEAEMGFHIIIDRRKDRWNSVKAVLLRISEFFPGIIHAVYVLRPASFLQKALSEVSNKLFKEEFRFRVLVCSCVEELYEHFDRSQLTSDLGGELQYSHSEWIQQRIALEKFSTLMKEISSKLDDFMHEIVDCDMGNDPTQTKELLDCQESRYKALKTELSSATTQGEELLTQVRKPNLTYNIISHVAAVERLLVQLEETEKQFDSFWQKHSMKLNHWLMFRTFLLNFKQMQATLDSHLKNACDMTEVGETAVRVDGLIQEANEFEKLCNCDLDAASAVIEEGEKLMKDPLSSVDHIESKCEELRRTSSLLIEKIQKRSMLLIKARELMDRIDKANEWCATGVEILAGEGGLLAVDKLLDDAKGFGLAAPEPFRDMLLHSATQETRALVTQVCQRVEDVWLMVSVKRASLQRAAARPARPVHAVPPHVAASQMETSGGSESSGGEDAEARRSRRGHVLAELLQTERAYVQELGSILSRETFFRLYSYYCQNIPRSERLRETLVDTHLFLQACQQRLGHKLPLAAYLLKPVQRITKYQLLLKDLLRYSECGSMSSGLQQALDCMLVVLKCVNDSMHQIAITGVPVDLSQQGELLLQSSFLVVSENKRDLRLRIRPRRRHIFLYEKAMLFCKSATKNSHNKATYHFKHDLQMSQIGLTESVKGDLRKFEVWRQGRAEVHTITAPTAEIKRVWVERIKRVLLDQLNELKGERVRQYGAQHRTLIQASSWELGAGAAARAGAAPARAASCDAHDEPCWSTDPSDDDDDDAEHAPAVGCALVALSDYTAVGASEVSLREGQHADLLKVGCAGWWYVRLAGGQGEGWAPAAYLDQRKTSRSSSRSHDLLHDH
ncbi:guanine nucleotide exchange factor DBS-like isoform X4 [Vanessa cardui]|uniref:guanine nucleotide exchange factor DBS-like isoform X4 n=1 Tax=Vanessa cardui TaxID=171605 RepID=UPI001F133E79|nr:guanine nucleotide exchange factor DBS-like isoform X4 [Vanessa cardui]